jgi:hypothetical protein
MRKLIIVLIALFVAVAVFGFYLNWFNVSTRHDAEDDNKVTVGLEIDKDRIKQDTEAARRKAQDLADKTKNARTGAETAKGTIVRVEEQDQRLTVMTTENKELTIQMDSSSKVRIKAREAPLTELREGDRVTVVFEVKNGHNIARSVTVESAA